MNPEKWEDADAMDANSGVMVSNLPLIFANGEPVSLNKMTLEELLVFVPFMVNCSIGEDSKTDWSQLRRPVWWPNKQPFRLPSASKSRMVQLVVDCYSFHGCQYLLQFCATLHQMKPSGGYKFTDNRDGTTSMYNGHNGKLLVTFRNENREYDLKSQKAKSHGSTQKKRLLSNLPLNKKKNVMVQPPQNVYLCDKCDDEFISFQEVQAHEKNCKGNSPSTPPMPSPDPEDLEEEVLDPADQVPFLSYFGLQPAEHTGVAPYTSPRKRHQSSSPVRKFYNHSYLLDISSPMGKYILSRTKYGGRLQMPEHYVTRYERHIRPSESDLVNLRERSSNRWIVAYRPRKEQQWVHTYCFNSAQRREKMLTIRTGLDRRSRMVLASCQRFQLRVKLKRLAKKVIDRYTRRGGSSVHVPCIDLTDAEDNSDGPVRRRPFPSSSFSSLSTPSYFSPATYLSNAATSSTYYLPDNTATFDTDIYINPIVPSIINQTNYFDNYAHNYEVDENVVDPLQVDEHYINNHYINSSSTNPPPLLPKIQDTNPIRNSLSPEGALPFISRNTQNKISVLSNNGVTVTSINHDFPQSNSSSLDNFNAAKSHSHQVNAKNSSSTAKLKPSRSNCSSAGNSNDRYDGSKSISNSSLLSNHSHHPSSHTSSGISDIATNSEFLPNKNEVSLVEVIELSSDDDDIIQDNGSYARSKNGYSHWSLDEPSSISGRDKRSLVSNGVTQDNSVLPLLPHFLSSTSDNPFFRSSLYHPSNIPNSIYERNCRNVIPSSALTIDSEGIVKAPLQVDEDISFNIRLSNHVKYSIENEYINNLLSCCNNNNNNNNYIGNNNNNNNEYGNNLFGSLASKVNKGFQYLTTFVKSKVYDGSNTTSVCSSINNNNNHDREHHTSCDKVDNEKEVSQSLSQSITTTKRSREMMSLLNDECRELKRRGIGMLEHINEEDSRVMTRCIAGKTLNRMFGLSGEKKCEGLSSEVLQERKSKEVLDDFLTSSNEVGLRNGVEIFDILPVKDFSCNGTSDESLASVNSDSHSFSILPPPLSSEIGNDFDENENYTPPTKNISKKHKLSRELSNLARDECKELRGMGFHPTDIVGSSDNYLPFILDSNESETEPILPVKRRPSLLSYKSSSGTSSKHNGGDSVSTESDNAGNNLEQMMQGNKKLSRELSKLFSDEWKELKRANAHPSQVTNLLSAERNVRSNSSHGGKKPGMMMNMNTKRSKPGFGRILRGQDIIPAPETRKENPRLSQRELIHTENGMCVLNYLIEDNT